jgi:hypothetical protein
VIFFQQSGQALQAMPAATLAQKQQSRAADRGEYCQAAGAAAPAQARIGDYRTVSAAVTGYG